MAGLLIVSAVWGLFVLVLRYVLGFLVLRSAQALLLG